MKKERKRNTFEIEAFLSLGYNQKGLSRPAAAEKESNVMDYQEWSQLSYSKKNHQLYLSQKETLRKLLVRNAISRAEYDRSLHDLTEKMQETG